MNWRTRLYILHTFQSMEYGVLGLHGTIVILHVEEAVAIEIEHVQNQYHSMVENIVVAMIHMFLHVTKLHVLVRCNWYDSLKDVYIRLKERKDVLLYKYFRSHYCVAYFWRLIFFWGEEGLYILCIFYQKKQKPRQVQNDIHSNKSTINGRSILNQINQMYLHSLCLLVHVNNDCLTCGTFLIYFCLR